MSTPIPDFEEFKRTRAPRTKPGVRLDGVAPALVDFARERDFTVTSGRDSADVHVPGSRHGGGGALDLRTRDKTPAQIEQAKREAQARGLNATFERAGQGGATGDHLHLSLPSGTPPAVVPGAIPDFDEFVRTRNPPPVTSVPPPSSTAAVEPNPSDTPSRMTRAEIETYQQQLEGRQHPPRVSLPAQAARPPDPLAGMDAQEGEEVVRGPVGLPSNPQGLARASEVSGVEFQDAVFKVQVLPDDTPETVMRRFVEQAADSANLPDDVKQAFLGRANQFIAEGRASLAAPDEGLTAAQRVEQAKRVGAIPLRAPVIAETLANYQRLADERARASLGAEIEARGASAVDDAERDVYGRIRGGATEQELRRAGEATREIELAEQGGGTLRGERQRRIRVGALEAGALALDPRAALELGGRVGAEGMRGARDSVAGLAQGIGVLGETLDRVGLPNSMRTVENLIGSIYAGALGREFVPGESAGESLAYQWGQSLKRSFGEDADLAPEFIAKVARGGGSSTSFLLGAMLTGGSSAGVGLLGALMQAGDTYEQLSEKGVKDDRRLAGALAGGAVGFSEMLGLGGTFNRATRGEFVRTFARWLAKTGREASEESLQEFFQTAAGDAVVAVAAKEDPNWPRILRGAFESAKTGALIGSLLGGAGHAAAGQGRQADEVPAPTIPVPRMVQRAESPSVESATPEAVLAEEPALVGQQANVTPVTETIIRHSDPRIDGGKVVGQTADGKLKVENNEGGVSVVKHPRRRGNREAALVRRTVEPETEGVGSERVYRDGEVEYYEHATGSRTAIVPIDERSYEAVRRSVLRGDWPETFAEFKRQYPELTHYAATEWRDRSGEVFSRDINQVGSLDDVRPTGGAATARPQISEGVDAGTSVRGEQPTDVSGLQPRQLPDAQSQGQGTPQVAPAAEVGAAEVGQIRPAEGALRRPVRDTNQGAPALQPKVAQLSGARGEGVTPDRLNTPAPRMAERAFPQSAEAVGLDGGADRSFEVITNKESLARASKAIEEKGVDRAIADLITKKELSAEDTATGLLLMRRLKSDGDLTRAVEVAEDVSRKLTEAGQAVQAASIVARLSPEGVLLTAQRRLAPGRKLTAEQSESLVEAATRLREAEVKVSTLEAEVEKMRGTLGDAGIAPRSTRARTRQRLETLQDRLTKAEAEARERLEAKRTRGSQPGINAVTGELVTPDKWGGQRGGVGLSKARANFRPATVADRQALKIPPAWTDVHISDEPGARLIAVGRDSKGRTQRIYSTAHTEAQLVAKFVRQRAFNDKLPDILSRVESDIQNGRNREEASVLRLIAQTGFRVGGEADTGGKVKAYGASTLRPEHVKIEGDTVHFDFIGKLGVRQQHSVTDAALARDIEARIKRGGPQLFHTNDVRVRNYLHSAGGNYKVHDFRTWNATDAARKEIEGRPAPTSPEEYWRLRDLVGDIAAHKIGDTRQIALETYVDPLVFESWRESAGVGVNDQRPKQARRKAGDVRATSEANDRSFRDPSLRPQPQATGETATPASQPAQAVRLHGRLAQTEAAARGRLEARKQAIIDNAQAGASTIPLDIADYVIIGAAKLARKGITVTAWADDMVKDFGEAIRPHLRAIYRESYAHLKDERARLRRESQERVAQRENPGPQRSEDIRRLLTERTQAQKDAQAARRDLERAFSSLSRMRTEKVLDAGTAIRRANLLSAARTHLRNLSSNTLFQGTEELARPMAAIGDMLAKRKTGVRTTSGLNIPAATKATIAGALTEGPARVRDIMLGREVLPLEGYRPGAESSASKMQLFEPETGFKILDAYVNVIFRSMTAGDAVFKVYAFRRELQDIARSQALSERALDPSVNARARERELLDNPTDAMLTEASVYADYATFQNQNMVSEAISGGKRKLGPAGKFVIEQIAPFDRTPTNIIARTLENSPLGFFSAVRKYRQIGKKAAAEELAGRVAEEAFTRAEQKEFARTFGRASTGTILAALGMTLAHKGLLSGDSDYDTDKADYMEKRRLFGGPGMLKIPGTNQRVSILDTPAGKAMATAAGIFEQMRGKKDADKAVTASAQLTANIALDQPLLRGLRDLAESKSVGEGVGSHLSSFVPGSASLKAAAEVADPSPRVHRGEGLTAPFRMLLPPQISGGRGGLPVDTGVNLEERGGLRRRVVRSLDPFNTTTEGRGPTKREKKSGGTLAPRISTPKPPKVRP